MARNHEGTEMAKSGKKIKKKAVKSKKKSAKLTVKLEKPEKPAEPKITDYPAAGAKVTEFENTLDRQLAGDTAPPKRPVGRPPKPPEPEQPELAIDIVAGVVKIPFELWSIGQGVKELALTNEEARQMAEPAKQLLEYYLPMIPPIAYAWVGLSVSSFWIMRARLLLIQEIRKLREQRRAESPPPAAPAQPGVKTSFPAEIKQVQV